jgi:hypothetical protein
MILEKPLGQVGQVQLQPNGLIIGSPGKTPTGYFFDPSRLVEVDQLTITPLGIEATLPDGEHVLDIHHINHPDKAYGDDDLVCVGFSAHYEAMHRQFGDHIKMGIAGENIIIDYPEEIWPDTLGQKLGIENQTTGEVAVLEMVSHASPCTEFSQFCLQSPYEKPAADAMKKTLQFLSNGRRGFLLVLGGQHDAVGVRAGDQVFLLDD